MSKIKKIGMYYEFANTQLINSAYKQFQNPIAEILMIHRVDTNIYQNIPAFQDLIISPEFLESLITEYLSLGYTFISINELYRHLNNPSYISNQKNIVLTIDDGYKDTFTNAFPILQKHHIPFVFYISSSFPDKTIPLWWNFLNDLIISNPQITLRDKKVLKCESMDEKIKSYVYLSKEILKMNNHLTTHFPLLFNIELEEIIQKYNHLLINWDEIYTMSCDDLCTIGAHSEFHYGLKYCDKQFVYNDLYTNKIKLENKLGNKIDHLAYPFGTHYSVGKREYSIAKEVGFKTATVTFSSKVYKYHKNNMYSIPRIMIKE